MSPASEPARRERDFLRGGLEPFMFRHGEHFPDLRALHQFKTRFRPIYEPRYLACPSTVPLPQLLRDLALLISRTEAETERTDEGDSK
jgi:phosphatidylglycerol lysyltransferase